MVLPGCWFGSTVATVGWTELPDDSDVGVGSTCCDSTVGISVGASVGDTPSVTSGICGVVNPRLDVGVVVEALVTPSFNVG